MPDDVQSTTTYSPAIQTMTREAWFAEMVRHIDRAAAIAREHGVPDGAEVNVQGATLLIGGKR
jgi:sugar phosphate isomerase/epimerase